VFCVKKITVIANEAVVVSRIVGTGELSGIESRTKLLCVGEDGMNDKSCCSLFLANLDE